MTDLIRRSLPTDNARVIDSAPPTGIRVSLLLFARYAELLGTDRLEFDLPTGATVRSIVSLVRTQLGGESLPSVLLVARNMVRVDLDAALCDGDEVALLPPMAGG
jgi:molybdopterin converting factor small subunit